MNNVLTQEQLKEVRRYALRLCKDIRIPCSINTYSHNGVGYVDITILTGEGKTDYDVIEMFMDRIETPLLDSYNEFLLEFNYSCL